MRARVQAFIGRCLVAPPPRGEVEAMALALWAWQREHNPGYASFCGAAQPRSLESIPAVPVALFRELPWCCFPPEQARHVFHTSGTTSGRPGVHRLLDAATYDLGSRGWFGRFLPDTPVQALSLIPSPQAAPHSSLSHMVGMLWPDAHVACEDDGLVRADEAWRWLLRAEEPVFVAATALSLASLLATEGCASLPDASMLMTTGGFKGRSLSVEPAQLLAEATRRLGGVSIVGEYGMTELSSQLWTRPWHPGSSAAPDPRGPFHPPPWLVPLVVDPQSGQPRECGEAGQLRFVDLANDHSVLAVETMDQGVLREDGGLLLLGRLPGSEARGCSLGVEEALRRSRR